jgi:hypothetical protein
MKHANASQAQLTLIMADNPQLTEAQTNLKKLQAILENTEFIKGTFFEYGKFLTKMDDACQLLNLMLSSKSIQDTVEVVRVFKLLHTYGLSQAQVGIRKMLTLVFSKE